MDCGGYKSDGGANVSFNVVDKVLDSKKDLLESTIAHSPIKNSISCFTSEKCDSVLVNGTSEVLADDESIQKSSIISEFSLDKQNELPHINIVIDRKQFGSDPDSNTTLDQSNVEQSNERIVESESCLDENDASDEVKLQLNVTQSSSVLKGHVSEEERSSDGDGISKDIFKGELASEKQGDDPNDAEYCSNICIEDNCTPVQVCVEETNLKSDSINNVNVQQAVSEPEKICIADNCFPVQVCVEETNLKSDSTNNGNVQQTVSESEKVCVEDNCTFVQVCVEETNLKSDSTNNGNVQQTVSESEKVCVEDNCTFVQVCVEETNLKSDGTNNGNVQQTVSEPEKVCVKDNCTFVQVCVEETNLKSDSINNENVQRTICEPENIVEVNQHLKESNSINQLLNKPQPISENDECISEEEVYLEVDDCVESDQNVDTCPDVDGGVSESDSENECEKMVIDSIISNLENEIPENVKPTGNSAVLNLPLSIVQSSVSKQCDELMSEEEVEDFSNRDGTDGDSGFEKQDKVLDEINNDKNVSKNHVSCESIEQSDVVKFTETVSTEQEHCSTEKVIIPENAIKSTFEKCEVLSENLKEPLENELVEDKTVTEGNCLEVDDSFNNDENAMEIQSESELLIVDDDEESEDDVNDKVVGVSAEVSTFESVSDKCQADEGKNLDLNADKMACTETKKDTKATESPKNSSELDFDLDDAIEEFAKVESNVVKLSDELDSLVEEFVEAECSNSKVEVEVPEPQIVTSESEDELELLIEDFKAVNSDDDCFIVEDTNSEIVINVDCDEKDSVKSSPSKIESKDKHKALVDNGDVILLSSDQPPNAHKTLDVVADKVKCVESSSLDGNITSNLIATEHDRKMEINCSESVILNNESINVNVTNTNFDLSSEDLSKIKNDQTHKSNHNLFTNIDVSNEAIVENSNSIVSSFISSSGTSKPNSSPSSDSLSKEIIKEVCDFIGTDQNLNSSHNPGSAVGSTKLFLKGPAGNTDGNCSSAVVDVLNHLVNIVHSNVSVNFNTELKNMCNSEVVNGDTVSMKRTSYQFQDASLNISVNTCDKLESEARPLSVDAKTDLKSEQAYTNPAESGDSNDMDEIIIDCLDLPGKNAPESKTFSSIIKPLNSVCENLGIQEESKKRKLDELDKNTSGVTTKKLKEDKFETPADNKISLSESVVGSKVKEKVRELIPEKTSNKFVTKKKCLDKIVTHVVTQTIQDLYKGEIDQQRDTIKELEEKIQALDEDMLLFQTQASELVSAQQKTFQQYGFNPQVQVRTVGVNVKIFRECDLQNVSLVSASAQNRAPVVPRVEQQSTNKPAFSVPVNKPVSSLPATKLVSSIPVNKPVSSLPINKPVSSVPVSRPVSSIPVSKPVSVLTNKPQPMPPQQMKSIPIMKDSRPTLPTHPTPVLKRLPTPRLIINSNRPRQIATSQRVFSVSPNVTSGNAIATVITNPNQSRPLVPRLGVIPTRAQTATSGQVIDLTDEESIAANRRTLVSTNMVTVPPTVSKVNLPRLPNNQNVLVPISNLFQMLPSSTQSNSQLSVSNPIQVSRQTLVSSLPQGLGPKTVAYIMPANNAHVTTIGGRGGIPVPPFLSGSNPGVRTLFVHVTNSGAAPSLSSIVNSSSRMHAPVQSLLSTNTAPSSSSSGLVLFPRAVKHPAPFPQTPTYPVNLRQKALPPKPSLKGSKASHGIILSWNMSLHSAHADIFNYQLFAYQETSGVVNSSLWKKVGDVKALPLPMACTLTQFIDGNRYYFSVRAVDVNSRFGPFSDPVSIMYAQENSQTNK